MFATKTEAAAARAAAERELRRKLVDAKRTSQPERRVTKLLEEPLD
jgi:hypothetical protein